MGLLFIGPAITVLRQWGPVLARGLAHYERPLFKWAYQGNRMGRIGKPIYRGYKAGTVIGTVGAGLRDAYISSIIPEASEDPQTRTNMVKPRPGRQYNQRYNANRRRRKPYCPPRRRYR